MLDRLPVRVRLTLWYVLLMAVTFAVFGVLLYVLFQRSLMSTLDGSLQIAVSQTSAGFDVGEDLAENGRLIFENAGAPIAAGFGMRMIGLDGTVWDTFGARAAAWGPTVQGYSTQRADDEFGWRAYTEPILDKNGNAVGWMQAAQSLESVTDTLQDFRDQLLWGIPLILLLAGLGGYFLADRALRPIANVTDMAQEITAHDLSRRLDYQGPADEIGRLAHTFDGMLERLQSAFRRERRFTSDAAHELRTPLTVLKGQIEVTLSRPRRPEEYETKLQELAAHVERLIRLSNALLFLSGSDQNQLSWQPAPLNLTAVLEVIVEQIRTLASEKRLAVKTKLPPQLPVYGDTDPLTRLFLNLLDNAVKYTPPGGEIAIEAVNEPNQAKVVIHNSGPGIPPEHLPHLFERFYRADADRSRETGGSGLGLAIAREIVRLHGGEIVVHSEAGQGVTFTVRLPSSHS